MLDFDEMALEIELVPGARNAMAGLRTGRAHKLLPVAREAILSGAETITLPAYEALALITIACILAEIAEEEEAKEEPATSGGTPHA